MTQASQTQTTSVSSAASALTNRHVAGVILLAGGYGWISGNFVQPFFGSFFGGFIDIVHFLPAILLVLFAMRFFRAPLTGASSKGASIGITVIAILAAITCVVFILLGASNPDPNSVGVHTFEDLMPVIVLVAGVLSWFSAFLPTRRS